MNKYLVFTPTTECGNILFIYIYHILFLFILFLNIYVFLKWEKFLVFILSDTWVTWSEIKNKITKIFNIYKLKQNKRRQIVNPYYIFYVLSFTVIFIYLCFYLVFKIFISDKTKCWLSMCLCNHKYLNILKKIYQLIKKH